MRQSLVHQEHEDVEGVEAVHQEDERVAQLADGHLARQQQDGHSQNAPPLRAHGCK